MIMIKVIRYIVVVVLFICCATPIYERAAIQKGLLFGGGIGFNSGSTISGPPSGDFPYIDRYIGGLGTLFLKYGFSEYFSLFLQINAGKGFWLTYVDQEVRNLYYPRQKNATFFDAQFGTKFSIGEEGEYGAGRISIGYPSILDLCYLHDFNNSLTGDFGIGLRGLSLGLAHHYYPSEKVILHTAVNIAIGWEQFNYYGYSWEPHMPAINLGCCIEKQ